MKNSRLVALAAVLCAGMTAPAFAAMDRIGSVTIDRIPGREAHNVDLGGPVDSLALQAYGSDVDCRAVSAQFGNGNTRQIFSGRLYQGRAVTVDLPGDQRNVTRLAFNCVSRGFGSATVGVSADIGAHRADWQRNPNFARLYARLFNWSSLAANNWQYLGAAHFIGNNDTDGAFAGWRGHQVSSVALKPLDAGARCSRVIASFGNGTTQVLNVNNGDYIRQGVYYKLDLRGDTRNLVNLAMRCRATNSRDVTIQIFTGT